MCIRENTSDSWDIPYKYTTWKRCITSINCISNFLSKFIAKKSNQRRKLVDNTDNFSSHVQPSEPYYWLLEVFAKQSVASSLTQSNAYIKHKKRAALRKDNFDWQQSEIKVMYREYNNLGRNAVEKSNISKDCLIFSNTSKRKNN